LRRRHRPVFVDDSGRRRRVARIVGTTSGGVALAYVVFVGMTFTGVPGLGQLDAPGLGQLTNPAGEQADVGSDPVEQALPDGIAGVAGSDGATTTTTGTSGQGDASTAPATTAVSPITTTTLAPATTTTVHGQGATTSVPSPNSTVPDKGGPPTSRPGGQ
jgi:cytoskeletal protein RodZ